MKTLTYNINYEKFCGPRFLEPLRDLPEPWDEATAKQAEWYYKLCQLMLDQKTLNRCQCLYARKLIEEITHLPHDPDTKQVNDYLKITAVLAHEMALSPEEIQKAGVPVLF